MALYWELALCYGSLMGLLIFSVKRVWIRKNNTTVKYLKMAFLAVFLVSAAAVLFTVAF